MEKFYGEILSVDEVRYVKTWELSFGWYPDAPITIKAHIEYNELCREE